MTKIKSSGSGCHSRMGGREESLCELEDRILAVTQSEKHRASKKKRTQPQRSMGLQKILFHIIGIPEGGEKEMRSANTNNGCDFPYGHELQEE
jgi:hypothetical protein